MRRCVVRRQRPLIHDLSRTSAHRHFRAVVARSAKEAGDGPTAQLLNFDSVRDLPRQDQKADVEVAVTHSDLNFKDGMILLGQKGVVSQWPIVAGIDYAGHVVRSSSTLWKPGDRVVLTGNKAGQHFDGGYSERATCRAEWLIAPPTGRFELAETMAIGTAGVTAAMCVHHLECAGEVKPSHGPVLVTGAAGGLGQVAIALLAARGFEVIASTGRQAALETHLRALGAAEVIDRLDPDTKPLSKQRWAGVIDAVGGSTLAAAIAQTAYRGAVASTGVASGGELQSTVYPFILRGVRLLGVDSTLPWDLEGYPLERERWVEWQRERRTIWELLAESLSPQALALVTAETIGLEHVISYAPRILKGETVGRVVVDVSGGP